MAIIKLALKKYQRVLCFKKHTPGVSGSGAHLQQRWLGQISNLSIQFSAQNLDNKSIKERITVQVKIKQSA